MAGLLESFGQGLQGAGAVLSDNVYKTQAVERQEALVNVARGLQIVKAKRALDADTKFSEFAGGLQPSAMKDSGAMLDAVKGIPMDVLAESPRAQQFMGMVSQMQTREAAQADRKEKIQFRYDQLEQQAEVARQRSQDVQLGIQERAAADKRHQALQMEIARMRDTASHEMIDLRRDLANQKKDSFGGENGELLAALAEKGVSLPAGFRSRDQQLGLLNSLRSRNPDLSSDQIAEKVKNGQISLGAEKKETQIAAGIAGKVSYAENEIKQIAPLVREASAKVPRGQFVPYNKLKQMGETQISNPDLKELKAYMTTLSNAYDMLAARGGTDMEKRKENRRQFDAADSPEALERILQVVVKEAEASGRAGQESSKPRSERGGGGDKKDDPLGIRK